MGPFILRKNVPSHMLATFDNAMLPVNKWACIIQEAVRYEDKDGGE
jgi:hypothetical protein